MRTKINDNTTKLKIGTHFYIKYKVRIITVCHAAVSFFPPRVTREFTCHGHTSSRDLKNRALKSGEIQSI